jgi:hypothetical protein
MSPVRTPNLQKRWGHVLTDPARSGREAPRVKRARRKVFGISMPFCLIPCRLLALVAAMGRPRGALRAQTGCRGRASRARPPARGTLRAQGMCLPGKHIQVVVAGWAHPTCGSSVSACVRALCCARMRIHLHPRPAPAATSRVNTRDRKYIIHNTIHRTISTYNT